ncbi:MAG: GYD domain-containing protein [Chloroflexi bacterium]|nr:GYD domain-containing protein [Chloroflexota bacterium]
MPTFMTQFSYTAQAWAAMAKNPEDRGAAINALLEKLGGRLLNIYYTMGDYDGFIIFEAPDGATATTAIIAATTPGHLKTTKTTQLFTMNETMDMASKAGSMVYSAPKG